MNKYLIYLFMSSILVNASNIDKQINDVVLAHKQEEIFQKQIKLKSNEPNIYTTLKTLPISKSLPNGRCIKIMSIDANDVKLIKQSTLHKLFKPYINRCDTINDIKNLLNKINNIYIKEAFVTSRAYIKPQDLNSGHLIISAVEGKIDKIKAINTNKGFVFLGYTDSYLNLRDIESSIEQLNRLHSIKTTMKLNPSKKQGYSDIYLIGKKVASAVYGNIGINNFGVVKTGKYQISSSLSWENPLNLNDTLSLSLNTTSKQSSKNRSLGSSISYGLPIGKAYVEFGFSYFKYKQVVNGLNKDYQSNGNSKSYYIKAEYKLFHNKTQKGKLDIKLTRKVNKNYLAGVYLDTSSSKLTTLDIGYTHSFTGATYDGYINIAYHRGLKLFGVKSGYKAKPTFNKLTTDISFNKKWQKKNYFISYNFSLHGQYAKEGIIGSEQIGVGGIYSVRGFRTEGQLSGNKGFYIRNEFSFTKPFKNGFIAPYIGLDYGYVAKNKSSYGGKLAGGALGLRIGWKSLNLDIFRTFPIKDSNKITYKANGDKVVHHNKGFFGINLSYKF